ncbi:MAG TPA: hypothetical protein VFC78_04145 [Tepidisphaeraceae bacterium]|nr:hypothetical protein [Tepidisphaeraceae bacterium]
MTILLLTDARTFFLSMAVTGMAGFAACWLLREPGRAREARPVKAGVGAVDDLPAAIGAA